MKTRERDIQWFEAMVIANKLGIKAMTSQIKRVRKELRQNVEADEKSIAVLQQILEHLLASRSLLKQYQEDFNYMLDVQKLLSIDPDLLKEV
ncbi:MULTISPECIES: hypothetical protein [Acinetobacter]|uniref:hypothetical protein n=1 Tax=Acinetobacter TaxID=469 RepID=UPI001443BD6C|nr:MULTISPECIES: hypothetical protein [Acinetobacter]MDM1759189.1 hypothetical protein [Acinetobacter sp. 256-1]MDM1762591.1 hypothetical protein [Acinetobacter sp. 251-1]